MCLQNFRKISEFIHATFDFFQASDVEHFGLWLEQLQQHRFYRQNQMNHGSPEDPASPIPHFSSPGSSLPRGLKPPTSLTGKNENHLFLFHEWHLKFPQHFKNRLKLLENEF